MAVTIAQATNLNTNTFESDNVGSTPLEIKAASSTLFSIEVDNSENETAMYLKLYNVAAAPTVGTTAPDMVMKIPSGEHYTRIVNGPFGQTWGTGIFVACVTTGGTAGSAAPENPVSVRIKTS